MEEPVLLPLHFVRDLVRDKFNLDEKGVEDYMVENGMLQSVDLDKLIQLGFTFADFYSILSHSLVRLSDSVCLTTEEWIGEDSLGIEMAGRDHVDFTAGDKCLRLYALPPWYYELLDQEERPLPGLEPFCRLLGTSTATEYGVSLKEWSDKDAVSADGLSSLVEDKPNLKLVRFTWISLAADRCRVLEVASRSGLRYGLVNCCIYDDDAAEIFAECVRDNRGPILLVDCAINSSILFQALRGNTSVKTLRPWWELYEYEVDGGLLELARMLPENKGITHLQIYDVVSDGVPDATWGKVFRSMEPHPTLKTLILEVDELRERQRVEYDFFDDETKKFRASAMAKMLQKNKVLERIEMPEGNRDEDIFEESIYPSLACNRYGKTTLNKVKQSSPANVQQELVGHELQENRNDLDRVYMIASEFPAFIASAARDTVGGEQRKRKAHP